METFRKAADTHKYTDQKGLSNEVQWGAEGIEKEDVSGAEYKP